MLSTNKKSPHQRRNGEGNADRFQRRIEKNRKEGKKFRNSEDSGDVFVCKSIVANKAITFKR